MSLKRQVEAFNSFDVLITPHSSSNVNNLFTKRRSVVVEVVHMPFNTRHWTWAGDRFIASTGHAVSKTRVSGCDSRADHAVVNCDLRVNTTILASNLLEATRFMCEPTRRRSR
jgi:hypothetical protein